MRPSRVTLNAAGYSAWVPIDYIESWFGVGLAVVLSEDGALTYSVQFTLDPPWINQAGLDNTNIVSVSRSGTTATVTDKGPYGIGHGLTTGDNVIIKSTGSTYLDSPSATIGGGDLGWQVASTPTNSSYTYTVSNSGPTADGGTSRVSRIRVFAHSTLVAQTTRQNGTIAYPVQAVRLYISAYTSGFADLTVVQGQPR